MSTEIVFTLTGPDRVGLVEEVTQALLDLGGNVETSRMMRLGGEFAVLLLASLPEADTARLDAAVAHLADSGYKVTWTRTHPERDAHAGWRSYRIEVEGADHEGIIHEIARGLSQRGISIESAETETRRAPLTATPLFSMSALVVVPPRVREGEWRAELAEAARQANVELRVAPAE